MVVIQIVAVTSTAQLPIKKLLPNVQKPRMLCMYKSIYMYTQPGSVAAYKHRSQERL